MRYTLKWQVSFHHVVVLVCNLHLVTDGFEGIGASCGSSLENTAASKIWGIISGSSQVILFFCVPQPKTLGSVKSPAIYRSSVILSEIDLEILF